MKNFVKGFYAAIRILLSAALMVGLVYGAWMYLSKAFRNRDLDAAYAQIHGLPEHSMDYLVLGSSQAQYSFMPAVFYEDTGLYGYVAGSACQPLEVSYEMLKEFLKTQDPKLVILEVYTAMPLRSTCEADVCYVMAQAMMSGEEKRNTIAYLPEEKQHDYYDDFFNNHNTWKDLEDFSILLPENADPEYPIDWTFGYDWQDGVYWIPEAWWRPRTYQG